MEERIRKRHKRYEEGMTGEREMGASSTWLEITVRRNKCKERNRGRYVQKYMLGVKQEHRACSGSWRGEGMARQRLLSLPLVAVGWFSLGICEMEA